MIYELLKPGRENAVSSADLLKLTGLSGQRDIRRAVAHERDEGAVILSDGLGYYLPDSIEAVEQFIRMNHKRACSIESALKSARNYVHVNSYPDQVVIDGFEHNYTDLGIEP